MNPTAVPHFADPANHTPEERAWAVAAILAAGLLRLGPPVVASRPGPENVSESLANQLAIPAHKSVTVSAG